MAIKMRKPSAVVALCSLANFVNAIDRVLMPIAIVPMTDEYQWDLSTQGWILSAFAFGYLPSQIIGATAASRYGGKRVLAFAVSLWSISTLITPFIASSSTALITARVILGLGEGLGLPTIFHVFGYRVSPEERARAFAYLVAAGSIGQTIASAICPHMSWPVPFILFGTIGLLWTIMWLGLYDDRRSLNDDSSEAPPLLPFSAKAVPWRELLSHWALWAIYIAHFAMNWSNYIIMQWLPTYLTRYLGGQTSSLSLTAVPYIANSLCGIGFGHLADDLSNREAWSVRSVRRVMTAIGLIGPGIFLLAFCAVNNLALAVLFVTISMGLCAGNSAGHLSNHADVAPNHSGYSFAISNTMATIPGILCGPLTAALVTSSDGRWFPVFVLAACINFTAAVIYCGNSKGTAVVT
ncbi:unnamed protein product [Notodromas monacha]|uniref:Major facilitator superfamily (MFS) profile domain-containing protein n=1 Tax=Notodromas monacha TaxID=399045 RepID=A0A7R9GAB7_9CRUS|nr:unnamed protein product [Notodromas monacha]CAG0913834.1 unnamed protein product [Notodromas monacha]